MKTIVDHHSLLTLSNENSSSSMVQWQFIEGKKNIENPLVPMVQIRKKTDNNAMVGTIDYVPSQKKNYSIVVKRITIVGFFSATPNRLQHPES